MIESAMKQRLHDPVHEPSPRPITPPEWTPPEWTPSAPPRPDRTPTLPMILTPELGHDDVVAQLLRRRIVMLTGRLDWGLADDVAARLLLLDQESQDVITLHVSVSDAELDAALALVATIDLLASEVTAIAGGTVGGAAVAVYAAAARRQAHPHTQFVLREPHAELHGDTERVRIAAEQHQRQLETLRDRIAAATGRDKDDVERDIARGRLLTAAEAVAYGLVQELTRQ